MKKSANLPLFMLFAATAIFLSSCHGHRVQTIEFYSTKNENLETLEKIAQMYENEKKGSVRVEIVSPKKATDSLRSRMQRQDYPDIIAMGGNSFYTEFQRNGWLLNLSSERYAANIKNEYRKMLFNLNSGNSSKLYAIPYSANVSGILCNKDIFEKNGIKIPLTWSELLDCMDKFSRLGIKPFELTFRDEWTTLPLWNSMVSAGIGSDFVNKKNKGTATFTETHTQILEKFLTILKKNSSDFSGKSYDDGNKEFAEGKAAMLINGNWAIPEILRYNPEIHLEMIAFPTFEDPHRNTLTSGLDVILALPNKRGGNHTTIDFMEYLIRPETAKFYNQEQFAISAIKNGDRKESGTFTIGNYTQDAEVKDYPDHFYPTEFGNQLSFALSQFAINYLKQIPDESNIRSTLTILDKAYEKSIHN